MTEASCIWCLGPGESGHNEHIFPEAIGCPPGFVLPGSVVCRKCNNALGHLDKAVADEFDFLSFLAGVPRKKGRPPVINSRGNVFGTIEPTGPTLTFNMERHSVAAHDGSMLAPLGGSRRNIRAQIFRNGNIGTVTFDVGFGGNAKFIRGLTKIGYSSLAYFLGAHIVRRPSFAAVRDFVLTGSGIRHVLLSQAGDKEYRLSAWAPYAHEDGGYACGFRIAQVDFLVDLTATECILPAVETTMRATYGHSGWCVLPLRSDGQS
jgi:hypothetical protein